MEGISVYSQEEQRKTLILPRVHDIFEQPISCTCNDTDFFENETQAYAIKKLNSWTIMDQ